MTRSSFKFASLFIAAGFAGSAFAAPITVSNPGFDDQAVADAGFIAGNITDWVGTTPTGTSSFGIVDPGAAVTLQPTSGENAAYMVRLAELSQTLTGFSGNIGDTVTVTFDAWVHTGAPELTVNFAGLGPQAVAIDGTVQNFSHDFVLTSAINSGVLEFAGATTDGGQLRLDTVSVELTPVPEPGSLALLGLGGLLIARRRRRRRA